MITETTMDVEDTSYANAASTYAGTKPEHWDSGVVVYNTLPASDWNWMWNYATSNLKEGASDLSSLIDEYVALGEAIGITVSEDTTLTDIVNTYVTRIATTDTPGAILSSDEDYYISVDENGYASVNGLTDFATTVDDISSSVSSLETTVTNLSSSVSSLETDVTDLSSLEADVTDLSSLVSSLETDVTNVQDSYDALALLVPTLVSEVEALSESSSDSSDSSDSSSIDFSSMSQIDLSLGPVSIEGSTYTQAGTTTTLTSSSIYISGTLETTENDWTYVISIAATTQDLDIYIDATATQNIDTAASLTLALENVLYVSTSSGYTCTLHDTGGQGFIFSGSYTCVSATAALTSCSFPTILMSLYDSNQSKGVVVEGGTYSFYWSGSGFCLPDVGAYFRYASISGGVFNFSIFTTFTGYATASTTVSSGYFVDTGTSMLLDMLTCTISGGTFNVDGVVATLYTTNTTAFTSYKKLLTTGYAWFTSSVITGGTFNIDVTFHCASIYHVSTVPEQVCCTFDDTSISDGSFYAHNTFNTGVYNYTSSTYRGINVTAWSLINECTISGGLFDFTWDLVALRTASATTDGSGNFSIVNCVIVYADMSYGGTDANQYISGGVFLSKVTGKTDLALRQFSTYLFELYNYDEDLEEVIDASLLITGGFFDTYIYQLNGYSSTTTDYLNGYFYMITNPDVEDFGEYDISVKGAVVLVSGNVYTGALYYDSDYGATYMRSLITNLSSTGTTTFTVLDNLICSLGHTFPTLYLLGTSVSIMGTIQIPAHYYLVLPSSTAIAFDKLIVDGILVFDVSSQTYTKLVVNPGGHFVQIEA